MAIEVLRLGHRPQRDKRITTHVCLTARALGARKVHIAADDASIVSSVTDVASRFGGSFEVVDGASWKKVIRDWKAAGGRVVHLTMYGVPLNEWAGSLEDGAADDTLVVVGAEKVPAEVYDLADHNVAVGSQPHSEVAALALCLDRLRGGAWEHDSFPGAEVEVVPSERGKETRTQR